MEDQFSLFDLWYNVLVIEFLSELFRESEKSVR